MAALVAYGIGVVASATGLYILGVLRGGIQLRDLAGKLVLEAVPVSIGASVAMSAFGNDHRLTEQRRQEAGYWGMMGMALAGAMLFGFGVSGTEEVLLIADQLTWSRALLLMAVSVIQVYAIVYVVDFKQRPQEVGTARHVVEVARETISTYALSLLVGAYLLWTFRTLDGKTGAAAAAYAVVTIGFVTSLGAAAADLLI
jgi:putative integral membrane protein (TIGR02587 family)